MKKVTALLLTLLGMITLWLVFSFSGMREETDSKKIHEQLQQQISHLLEEEETIVVNWLHSLNPLVKETEGDVVWNERLQSGVIRLRGLSKLEASEQYHLWVFDLKKHNQEPSLAAKFYGSDDSEKEYLVGIKPIQPVEKVFKFLITKKKITGSKTGQGEPLLFAQP